MADIYDLDEVLRFTQRLSGFCKYQRVLLSRQYQHIHFWQMADIYDLDRGRGASLELVQREERIEVRPPPEREAFSNLPLLVRQCVWTTAAACSPPPCRRLARGEKKRMRRSRGSLVREKTLKLRVRLEPRIHIQLTRIEWNRSRFGAANLAAFFGWIPLFI
jgi:hypothetical protein